MCFTASFPALVLLAISGPVRAVPQGQPTLQITSPSAKIIVNPGQTVTVSVTSSNPGAFSGVELTGDDPLGFVGTISALPGRISVTIPASQIDCGSYFLTVSGTPVSSQGPVSATLELDVERPDLPITIAATLSPIIFDSAGEQFPLDLLAGFSDGKMFTVTASSYVTYSSSNPAIATVDARGLVTAVAPGRTTVAVKYALGNNNNQIFIPVTIPNPVNTGPPPPTISSLNPNSGPVGTSVTITGTNFGSPQGRSVVSFNGAPAQPSSWSTTSILAPVPSGATTGNVIVTIAGLPSNSAIFIVSTPSPNAIPQSQPTLQITSPTAGLVVNPGQTLTASVTSPAPNSFPLVAVYGGDPIGLIGSLSSLPGQLSLTVPSSGITLGSHTLTAIGTPSSGGPPVLATVSIDVERADFPVGIWTTLPGLEINTLGEQARLVLYADFQDGTSWRATGSSYVTFSCSNAAVATVDSSGLVTAVGPGAAVIAATYTLGPASIQAAIPISVAPSSSAGGNSSSFVMSAIPGGETVTPRTPAPFALSVNSYN